MNHIFKSFPLLFLSQTFIFGENFNSPSKVIDLERLIPTTVDKNCDVAIFTSNHSFPFEFICSDRVMLSSYTNEFYLTKLCTVLILANFVKATDAETTFVRTNFVHIQVILIFPMYSNFGDKDLKLAKHSFHKNILVFRNDGNPMLSHVPMNISCTYYNLSCTLKGASLTVGYHVVLPYLQLKGWPKIIPGIPTKQIAPLTLNRFTDVNLQKLGGVEGELLKHLVTEYGMTFQIIAPPDMISGTKLSNGSWTGKYKMLAHGEVDVIAGSVSGTFEKHRIGEYSAPIFYTKFSLCSRKPEPRPNWDAPIKPFPFFGWLLLFASILIVGPAIWTITKLHGRFTRTSQKEQTVIHITAQAATTLLIEPWLKPPGGPASFIITAWLIACLIIQCLYSSNLTAHLSIPNSRKPLQTLEDAVTQKKTVLIFKGGTLDLYMKISKDPTVLYVTKYQAKYVNQSFYFGPSALDNPNIVATNEVGVLRYKMVREGKNPSRYYFSPKPLLKNFVSWLFKKDHFLIPAINSAILRATENGLLNKWFQDQFRINSNAPKLHSSNFSKGDSDRLSPHPKGLGLSLDHLEGVFLFWVMGVSFSILIFFSETIHKYFHSKKAYYIGHTLPRAHTHPFETIV